jgi:hypothetical protein
MGRRRPIDMSLEELVQQRIRPDTPAERLGDMSMEQLGQVEIRDEPADRLGRMSMEQLGQVEVQPARGEVLRGRVGKGGDPLADKSLDELAQIEVEQKPDFGSAAKDATEQGQVLRSPVGRDPREVARKLRDVVEPQIPDEMIEKDYMEQSAKGVSPEDQIKANVDEARQVAVMKFSQRQQQARQQYMDEVNRARAEQENQHWLEITLRGIADAAAAAAGQGANVYSGRAAEARDKRAKGRIDDAEAGLKLELDSIAGEETEANLVDQAQMVKSALDQLGIKYPEGAAEKNPKAFVGTYGGVVGKLPLQDKTVKHAFTPNNQMSMVMRATKEDNVARRSLSSLDRAINQVGTGAGDIGILYRFINQMDDTAAREGELDLAQSAQSIADRLRTRFGNITEGTKLGPELRQQIVEELQIARKQLQDQRSLVLGNYRNMATGLEAHPSVLQAFDRLGGYGEQSTVPAEDRKPTQPQRRLPQQADSGAEAVSNFASEAAEAVGIGNPPVETDEEVEEALRFFEEQ